MGFWLKKFVSFWFMPLSGCLALIVAGVLVGLSRRRRSPGRALAALGVAGLLFFGNNIASIRLVRPLEEAYPPIPELSAGAPPPAGLAACRYVAVLGGGESDLPAGAAIDELSSTALARIVEGVRIFRALPGARLIVSGPASGPRPSEASVYARAAESLGVPAGRILKIDTARDTEAESRAVRAIAGVAPVALVTSAWHMPRAAALFRRAGVSIVPCPADYSAPREAPGWAEATWDVDSLDRSTHAVHERLGILWLKLRGRLP